jgi:hypothetical protein
MDLNPLLALAQKHAWVPLAAVVIGAIVRLLKSDTPLPTVPAKWRPWFALGLGAVAGLLRSVAGGATWAQALGGGLTAALLAMGSHDAVITSARDGRELFTPKK